MITNFISVLTVWGNGDNTGYRCPNTALCPRLLLISPAEAPKRYIGYFWFFYSMLRTRGALKNLYLVIPAPPSLWHSNDIVSLFRMKPVILRLNFKSLYPGTFPPPLLLSHLHPLDITLNKVQWSPFSSLLLQTQFFLTVGWHILIIFMK